MGYLKKATKRIQRPFKKMKGYKQFFKQKDLYEELDNIKMHRWSSEKLKDAEKKVKRRMKIVEKFEKWPKKIKAIILVILFIAMAIMKQKEYRVATLLILTVFVIYLVEYVFLLVSNAKARHILEKNSRTLELEKARRVIGRHDYSNVEAIDCPELCAILAKAIEPRIDEVRYADKLTYNVYINGRCYRLKTDKKLEEKIKMTY